MTKEQDPVVDKRLQEMKVSLNLHMEAYRSIEALAARQAKLIQEYEIKFKQSRSKAIEEFILELRAKCEERIEGSYPRTVWSDNRSPLDLLNYAEELKLKIDKGEV